MYHVNLYSHGSTNVISRFPPNKCEICALKRQLSRKFELLEKVQFESTRYLASSLNDDRNMNSYPPELVVQLAPVMFVAGLDVPPSPEPVPSSTSDPPSLSRPAQDPFTVLAVRLRDALLSQRITAIWQPDKSKTFQTVLVDKVSFCCTRRDTFLIISQFTRISAFLRVKSHFLLQIQIVPCIHLSHR